MTRDGVVQYERVSLFRFIPESNFTTHSWFSGNRLDAVKQKTLFMRGRGVQGIIIFVILIELISSPLPDLGGVNMGGGMAAVIPTVMSELTNKERKSQNLGILTVNPVLNEAAQAKALDMATKGYFAHTSPEGITPWYWLNQAGYRYEHAGENLAVNFTNSKEVARAWMDSPTHRANIVKRNYTEVGTGVATGFYQGKEAIFVAQVYGTPLGNRSVKNPPKKQPIIPVKIKAPLSKKQPVIPVKIKAPLPKKIQAQVIEKERTEVLGVEAPTTPLEPDIRQKADTSPRNTGNLFLLVAWGFFALVVLLYALIRARNHHRDPFVNGAMVLVVIVGIFMVNLYISGRNTVVLEPLHYSGVSLTR